MHYLSLCCIAKDEDPYLLEWVAYHAALGVEHFYVYDNMSATPIREVLTPFMDSGRITIRRVPGERMQRAVYDDCLTSFGPQNFWIAFIDLDEFLLPMRDADLRVLLSEFEGYGGLGAPWHLFGSSGHIGRPQGLVLENYTEAFAEQESYYFKSIVRPERTAEARTPHHFAYKPGWHCVNEEHFPISPNIDVTFSSGELLRVNHYFLRSQQDFDLKMRRGRAFSNNTFDWDFFYASTRKPVVRDMAARRFLEPARAALQKGKLPESPPLASQGMTYEQIMDAGMAFLNAGQFARGLSCLCYGDADARQKADFWTLRALLARGLGDDRRVEVFLRESVLRESTEVAYKELHELFRRQGREEAAKSVGVMLQRLAHLFS